jgi:hypothetical protein
MIIMIIGVIRIIITVTNVIAEVKIKKLIKIYNIWSNQLKS